MKLKLKNWSNHIKPQSKFQTGSLGKYAPKIRLLVSKKAFTVLIGLIFLLAIITALDWPLRASIMVFFAGGLGLVLIIAQLYRDIRSKKGEAQEEQTMDLGGIKSPQEQFRAVLTFGWLLGLLLAIWLVGFLIAVPLFVFTFSKVYGAKWFLSLGLTILAFGFLYGLFEMLIHVPWPRSLLSQLMGG